MSFHIGQKVVCVDASDNPPLRNGVVYKIASLHFGGGSGEPMLHLVGVDGGKWGFYRRRFRPITERKTDISIFKRILSECDHRVDAPCDVEA